MSYAAVAAKNAPPEEEQPQPNQDLLEGHFKGETELASLPDVNHKMAVVDRDWSAHPETETSAGIKASDDTTALLNSVHHAPPPADGPHVSEVAPDPVPTPSRAEQEKAVAEKRKQAKAEADELKKDLKKAAGEVDAAAGQVKDDASKAASAVKRDVNQAASAVKKDASQAASAVKNDVKAVASDAKAKVEQVKANAPHSAEEAGARTGAAIDNAAHKAKQLSHQAEAKAKAAGEKVEARAEDLARDVKSAAANASDKAAELSRDAERKASELKKQAGEKLERAETALENYATRAREILLRPGTLGGLMGVANVGLLSTLGYYAYTRRNVPWNRNYVAAAVASTLSLFASEGVVAERYSTTPEGRVELERAKQEGSRAYVHAREIVLRPQVAGGALGALNVAVLAVVGYFGYQNWNMPAWDKKLVSAITCGLISLSAAEGLAANVYKQKELPRQKRKGNA
ncbi:hypothetical protein QFC21_002433 [Naganishia friedmannii]|uniref:Uncharacterized protein n=1 Tax=Naganishia friedmannii TaxID=89922 RepID=A0ACC2VXY1_9TREE|nr:hypothetical protein QFC21_002433 [Naganishia friedmannii]